MLGNKSFANIKVAFGDDEVSCPADQICFDETGGKLENILAFRNCYARDPDNCSVFFRGISGKHYHLRTDGTSVFMSPNIFQKEINIRKENCQAGSIIEIFQH